jgi:cobalt/nickel transport system permease protein
MHIPDGYLSPQTTISAFAAMVPFWAVAFKKVKSSLSSKRIPTLALCAAFTFIIMMFNVPVAGGSSAHAVGAVFVAIMLGPWAAVISVSTALLIQALVFGDGGIMSFGINCFNMAVVMPFTGYFMYKLIAGRSELGSHRSLVATFIGSFAGLNIAAIFASIEFGIQPLLSKTVNGAPLYCPYPLSVSVPSMVFAHSLIAGPVEGIVTVSAIAYIIKFAPQFLGQDSLILDKPVTVPFFKKNKAILIPFGVLVLSTPIGLLTTGTAWGEWGTDKIKQQLGFIPKGLEMLSDKWHALLPNYSLPAIGDGKFGATLGYILSAIIGIALITGLILFSSKLILKLQKEQK